MDIYKQINIVKATSYDFNASRCVRLHSKSKLAKMLSRYSRRKLKQQLREEL